MRPEVLADGVVRLPTLPFASNNAFLIEGDDELILIDPGLRATLPLLQRTLRSIGFEMDDVGTVVLTHAHLDHAGAAARFAAAGARILTHPSDAPFCRRGRQPMPEQAGLVSRVSSRVPLGFPKVEVEPSLHDRAMVGPLRVYHTPGHTPGHVSLVHEPTGTLLAGDALINPGFTRYPFAPYCSDLGAMRSSAARLGELEITAAGFAHGPPIRADARARILSFLDRRR